MDYDPKSQILVTTGVSEGIDLAIRAIADPGDEILVVEPSYVSYKPCVDHGRRSTGAGQHDRGERVQGPERGP